MQRDLFPAVAPVPSGVPAVYAVRKRCVSSVEKIDFHFYPRPGIIITTNSYTI